LGPWKKQIPQLNHHVRSYGEPISPEDKQWLKEIYRPEIKKLEKLLNWDCSVWLAD
jgi:hypothetical protein